MCLSTEDSILLPNDRPPRVVSLKTSTTGQNAGFGVQASTPQGPDHGNVLLQVSMPDRVAGLVVTSFGEIKRCKVRVVRPLSGLSLPMTDAWRGHCGDSRTLRGLDA
jgi:hypothetical protein